MERRVSFTRSALRALAHMPANVAQRIRVKIDQYAQEPQSLANNVTALKGSGFIRMRVGDWRVIMDADTLTVLVIDIGPRGGIYDR